MACWDKILGGRALERLLEIQKAGLLARFMLSVELSSADRSLFTVKNSSFREDFICDTNLQLWLPM